MSPSPRAQGWWVHCHLTPTRLPVVSSLLFSPDLLPPATKGLMAASPLGWLWERRSRGDTAFPRGTCPAALGQSTVAISYFWGPPGPLPLALLWERSHWIDSPGFSSPTINGDNLSCQSQAAWGCFSLGRVCLLPCLHRALWLGISACPGGPCRAVHQQGPWPHCMPPGRTPFLCRERWLVHLCSPWQSVSFQQCLLIWDWGHQLQGLSGARQVTHMNWAACNLRAGSFRLSRCQEMGGVDWGVCHN